MRLISDESSLSLYSVQWHVARERREEKSFARMQMVLRVTNAPLGRNQRLQLPAR